MEESQSKVKAQEPKKKKSKIYDVYAKSIITRRVRLPINAVGSGLKNILEQKISHEIEGKCINEGYVKPNSCKILSHSSGKIMSDSFIIFELVVECDICLPVEGMIIECVAKNITKAGVRAEIQESDDNASPVIIFIARDHHYSKSYFSKINENDIINVRVIGQRFELNDKYISVIAEHIEPNKPKLVFKTDN